MPRIDQFAEARVEFAGLMTGWDGKAYTLFGFQVEGKPELFGEYKIVWAPNGKDYNLSFGAFGFRDRHDFGTSDPSLREHFTAEEAQAIEDRMRAFANDRNARAEALAYPDDFLGGVSFQPDWIIPRRPTLIERLFG